MAAIKEIVVECCYCRAIETAKSIPALAVEGWKKLKASRHPDHPERRNTIGWCSKCVARFDVRE